MKAIFDCIRAEFAHKKRAKWEDLTPELKVLTEFESSLRGFSNKIMHLCTEVRPDNWSNKDYDLKRTLQNATYQLLAQASDVSNHPVFDVPDDSVMLQQMLARRLYNHAYSVKTNTANVECYVEVKITSAMPENGKYLVQMVIQVSIREDGTPLITRKARIHKFEFTAPTVWTLRTASELYTYVTNSLNRFRKFSVAHWMTEFETEIDRARQDRADETAARKAFTALPRNQRKWILDNAQALAHEFRFSH